MVLGHNISEGNRTRDIQISQDITFDTMLLKNSTLLGLNNSGFFKPSPIQLHAIPLGKCGFDLLLEAKSGTGKTAVFTVIALEHLDLEKGLQAVILAPTREIASQIKDVIEQIGSNYDNLNVEVVMGGLPTQDDIEKFKKNVHIVVGSPGRLRHLIQEKHIDVSSVRLLVLDEADKLMDKSFQPDINYIFSYMSKQKQVILSSATYPEVLQDVMKKYVQNAQHICPDSTSVLLGIKQLVTCVKSNSNIVRQTQIRFDELIKILSTRQFKQCLIFCNYQARVGEVCKMLVREKWPAEQLHGQQEQAVRLDALKTLQEYKCRILVSTDLAARGIDASNVDIVINFEPPFEWQTYLHRIGRTGRFGSYGIAITILSEGQEESKFKKLIATIQGSPNLHKLWGDEKYELDDSIGSGVSSNLPVEIETQNGEDYKELLDKLIGDNSENTKKIQSFDLLYNSFHKCKEIKNDSVNNLFDSSSVIIDNTDQIQSFDLLCNSFRKSQDSKLESGESNASPGKNTNSVREIQCFDLLCDSLQPKESKIDSFSELLNSFQTHKNDDLITARIPDTANVKESDKQIKEDISNKLEDFEHHNENNLTGNCIYGLDNNQSKEKEFNNNNYKNISNEEDLNGKNNIEKYEIYDDIEVNKGFQKALQDAGLPITFGSSKPKCRRTNKSKTEHVINTPRSKNRKSKEKISSVNKTPINEEYNATSCSNETQYNTNTSRLSLVESCDNYNHIFLEDNELQENTSITKQFEDSEMHRRYNVWYNQLKTNMKQIEMLLYIEELSKM